MKFMNFKNEQELMDFIDPNNSEHRNIMANYAYTLQKRYGISPEFAIKEAKRLLEAKKNGEDITSDFLEEFALDYKPPFVPVPRPRERHEKCGQLSEQEELYYIDNEVFSDIRAYHDLEEEDREKMEFYVKDTVEWYSEYYGLDKSRMVEILKALFRKHRKNHPYKYVKYKCRELNRMVGTEPDPDYRKYDRLVNKKEESKSLIWTEDEQK